MSSSSSDVPERIYLVSYPKIIFLYPTFFMGLIAALVLGFQENPVDYSNKLVILMNSAFLGVLAINLVVFSFDFPRTTSLTLFFLIAAIVLGGFLLAQYSPGLFPYLGGLVKQLRPVANPTFYHIFCAILGVIYFAVFVNVQFDYWEIKPNELLHHHGVLSNLERYSAPHLRITKEIGDVFEYALLRSGRLILHPTNEPRSIVLENVPFISQKEQQITRMLSALQVQIRPDAPAPRESVPV